MATIANTSTPRACSFWLGRAELGDVASAKSAVESAHHGQQHRRLAAIVGQRHGAVLVHGRQDEVRGRLARCIGGRGSVVVM